MVSIAGPDYFNLAGEILIVRAIFKQHPTKIEEQFKMQKLWRKTLTLLFLGAIVLIQFNSAFGQGQDSTRSERDILILAQLFPGHYLNTNQAYFDNRLGLSSDDRHDRREWIVEDFKSSELGENAFLASVYHSGTDKPTETFIFKLTSDNSAGAVRMKTYTVEGTNRSVPLFADLSYQAGCDLLWRREAGQYRGQLESPQCHLQGAASNIRYDMLLSERAFWVSRASQQVDHYAFDRARSFDCYIDIPGVSSGVDIPYSRFKLEDIHDLGGEKWITAEDGTEIGIRLFRVYWQINNVDDTFARPSFVIYVYTKNEMGEPERKGYAFTHVTAQRIGVNLMWMLGNCYLISVEDVKPFMFEEPRL